MHTRVFIPTEESCAKEKKKQQEKRRRTKRKIRELKEKEKWKNPRAYVLFERKKNGCTKSVCVEERQGVERNRVRGHHRRLRILAGPLWLIKGARSGLLCEADLLPGEI